MSPHRHSPPSPPPLLHSHRCSPASRAAAAAVAPSSGWSAGSAQETTKASGPAGGVASTQGT